MANYHEAFNRTLLEFLDDLISTFPSLSDFQAFKTATQACILVDYTVPQSLFNTTVTIPYEDYIMKKNEIFFLQEDYSRTGVNDSIVDKLKGIWKELDADNKETIWNYMRVLVTLSKKINSQG